MAKISNVYDMVTQIARFTWPTWGTPGSCRPQLGPMLGPWTLLSGHGTGIEYVISRRVELISLIPSQVRDNNLIFLVFIVGDTLECHQWQNALSNAFKSQTLETVTFNKNQYSYIGVIDRRWDKNLLRFTSNWKFRNMYRYVTTKFTLAYTKWIRDIGSTLIYEYIGNIFRNNL